MPFAATVITAEKARLLSSQDALEATTTEEPPFLKRRRSKTMAFSSYWCERATTRRLT